MLGILILLAAGAALANAQLDCEPGHTGKGPLADYVFCEDSHYAWSVIDTIDSPGVTTYVVNMTSQKWYDDDLHSRPIWWHYLTIHVPDEIRYPNNAMLYVSTGRNSDGIPNLGTRHVGDTRDYTANTGIVSAALRQIPAQPIEFAYNHNNLNFTRERVEDDIIAWTWREFLENTEDPNILLRWPMCKAVARAFDTMISHVQELTGNEIQEFFLVGQSKRGWTTWLSGAIDERINAMAPMTLSMLNTQTTMKHYFSALGGWPAAFGNYYVENITSWMDSPQARELELMVDPIEYNWGLDKPKLLVSGAQDEFFMMDDYWYFFDELAGPKYIMLMANTGHEVDRSPQRDELYKMLETFYIAVLEEYEFPELEWEREETETSGSLRLRSNVTPLNVTAWMTTTPQDVYPRRDFRQLAGIPPAESPIEWFPYPVEDLGDNTYFVEFEKPEPGPAPNSTYTEDTYDDPLIPPRIPECSTPFRAFFLKAYFPGPGGDPFVFTTEPNIIPDCMPFESCSGTGCRGILR